MCALLEHLRHQTLPADDFEVIVVDDCSNDDTGEQVLGLAPMLPFAVHLTRPAAHGGQAAARNVGWQSARSSFVAFTDDDVTPAAGWLEAGVRALEADPALGVVQGRTLPPPEIDLQATQYGPPNWDILHLVDGPTPFFEGCNLFFRRQALKEGGGFDEAFDWWGEDTAAGWRTLAAGWGRGFAPDAVSTHPPDRRGWVWFVRSGLREQHMIELGGTHPSFRAAAFWRPWAYRKQDAAFALALIGAVAAVWFLPALALILPYLWLRRPSVRHLSFFRLCVQIPVVDAARLFGHLRGSLSARIFVL
jgi:glycosyltransferase involved in cell wall biosynthesis